MPTCRFLLRLTEHGVLVIPCHLLRRTIFAGHGVPRYTCQRCLRCVAAPFHTYLPNVGLINAIAYNGIIWFMARFYQYDPVPEWHLSAPTLTFSAAAAAEGSGEVALVCDAKRVEAYGYVVTGKPPFLSVCSHVPWSFVEEHQAFFFHRMLLQKNSAISAPNVSANYMVQLQWEFMLAQQTYSPCYAVPPCEGSCSHGSHLTS